MAKGDKKSKKKAQKRSERKFLAETAQNKGLVGVLGGIGAAALGAGMYAQLYAKHMPVKEDAPVNPYMVLTVVGAALVMAAVWLGTSADPSIFVGAPGVGIEKNKDVLRLAWHSMTSITWDENALALVLAGTDESGSPLSIRVRAKSQPRACAWALREAQERVPQLAAELPENLADRLPSATDDAGEKIQLDALHVVGRRCAASGEIIAYEPDARVCTRCERVYHRSHVPETCACGQSLEGTGVAHTPGNGEPALSATA